MPDDRRYRVELDVSAGRRRAPAELLPDDPFLICYVGDFRGRAGRAEEPPEPLVDRRPAVVDRDDLDDVMARFAPRLSLEIGAPGVDLSFSELDDFHPDTLFERAPFFRPLREARSRMSSPGTFGDALAAILGAPVEPVGKESDKPASSSGGREADAGSDIAMDSDAMRAFLRRIVAPHVVPGEDPRREALLDDLDRSVEGSMRSLLHHPRFQALESLWRSVDFLVRRLETGASLKLCLLEATIDELRAQGAAEALSRALRRMEDGTPSVLVVDHAFGATRNDVDMLRSLAGVAVERGATLLGGAGSDLIGIDTFARAPDPRDLDLWEDEAWTEFRESPESAAVGLVIPRFLLRAPYGPESDPCERLPLDEMASPPAHEDFLWGSGAVAAVLLLGQEFAASGWRMQPGRHVEVSGLPLYAWRGADGPRLQACAESLMTDRLAQAILDAGPMVLATMRHGDTARLVRFQSIASPARGLLGPWSGRG